MWRAPLSWVTSTTHSPHRLNPLPLALATGGHCAWSNAARRALEVSGRDYRMAYLAGTLTGTLTPVLAGLAVTVSPTAWLPEGLRTMRPEEGMPPLPEFGSQGALLVPEISDHAQESTERIRCGFPPGNALMPCPQ